VGEGTHAEQACVSPADATAWRAGLTRSGAAHVKLLRELGAGAGAGADRPRGVPLEAHVKSGSFAPDAQLDERAQRALQQCCHRRWRHLFHPLSIYSHQLVPLAHLPAERGRAAGVEPQHKQGAGRRLGGARPRGELPQALPRLREPRANHRAHAVQHLPVLPLRHHLDHLLPCPVTRRTHGPDFALFWRRRVTPLLLARAPGPAQAARPRRASAPVRVVRTGVGQLRLPALHLNQFWLRW
jgi:hypothetical protein